MPTIRTNPAPSTNPSEDKMLDIQSLTEQVQRTAGAYSWWNRGSQVFIGATAIVAVLYFLFSGMALKRSSELNRLQNELSKAKDDQLASDLRTKDQRIAETNREAKRIEGEAGKKIEDAKAEAQVKIAEARAAADAKVGEVATRLAAEQRKAAEAQLALEKQLALASQNANPRLQSGEQLKKIGNSLTNSFKERPPVTFEVQYSASDSEALDFAFNVNDLLLDIGWKIAPMRPVNNVAFSLRVSASDIDSPVVNALIAAFSGAGFDIGRARDANLPSDRIVIVFGPQQKRRYLSPIR